jgi:hypothetical protein
MRWDISVAIVWTFQRREYLKPLAILHAERHASEDEYPTNKHTY